MEKFNEFLSELETKVTSLYKKYRQSKKEKKEKLKNAKGLKKVGLEALDWASAIIFAVVVVSLLNMWACQQFVVPSSSMEDTIKIGDRLIVNKRAYGTELYSYGPKRDDKTPVRGDVITFYSPLYERQSAFKESFRDLIFLGTFTLVNLNKDKNGEPLEKMFIKRAIGLPYDTVKFKDGDVFIKRFTDDKFIREDEIKNKSGVSYDIYKKSNSTDYYKQLLTEAKEIYKKEPYRTDALTVITSAENGIFVGEKEILPLGDNRFNSHDGRFFGPVPNSSINGKAKRIIFPFSHLKKL